MILRALTALFFVTSLFANTYTIERVFELTIDSSINPSTLSYIQSGFKKAAKSNNSLVLIKMDTPGGLVSTTKEIMTLIGEADFPVVVWITPEGASATSAGAIISSAAHFIFMSEGTNIGAATPITMGGDLDKNLKKKVTEGKDNKEKKEEVISGSDVRAKAVNDLVALTQSLSEARGRNPEGFGKMISEAKSYKTKEAKKLNLINGIASSFTDIQEHIENSSVKIKGEKYSFKFSDSVATEIVQMDLGQKLLNILANPSFAYILFLIGAALLYLELQAPGGFVAGSIGAVCLVLAGIGFQVLPLNFGALALIALSFILFVLEAYITSYGILTMAAIGALVSGSLFLFRSEQGSVQVETSLILSAISAILLFVGIVAYLIIKDLRNKKDNHFFDQVDETGKVLKVIEAGLYQVKAGGEIWKATSKQELSIGDKVLVKKNNDNHLLLEITKKV
jgi:membrane-bound serine protease (ClpP class)